MSSFRQALRKRLSEATPGPWILQGSGNIPDLAYWTDEPFDNPTNDERFIAHARTDVETLLSLVERLEGALHSVTLCEFRRGQTINVDNASSRLDNATKTARTALTEARAVLDAEVKP